jgi:hypothetical protein
LRVAGVLRAMDAGCVVWVVVPVRACGGAGSGLGGCWRGAAVWCGGCLAGGFGRASRASWRGGLAGRGGLPALAFPLSDGFCQGGFP